MWEMMLSWWWIRPLPTLEKKKIISNQKKFRISFRKSKSDRSKKLKFAFLRDKVEEEEEVKFLYESKSGKSIRRSMAWSEDHEPDTISDATKPYLDELIMENRCEPYCRCHTTFNTFKKMTTIEDPVHQVQLNQAPEPDSDTEDDPGKLLNAWLGQLNQKDVDNGFQKNNGYTNGSAPVVKRRQQQQNGEPRIPNNNLNNSNLKTQYRCSLINLEDSVQDEELDAILGELSVLESQFEEEIKQTEQPASTIKSSQPSPVASVGSNGSIENKKTSSNSNKSRTESPDTDSAFCDNLSVLSSCSTSDAKSGSSGLSSTTSTPVTEDQEAKIKAEKIKLAIEKIKEANVKKLFIKVFTSDGSAKSLLVDEKMSVNHVTRILAEKNHVKLDPRWTLVELIPDLYMERVYEDHENLVENCLMWKVDSKNTLWFIERPEKYDVFVRPERYLLGTSSSQQGDTMEDHARQELLEEYFSSSGVGAPELEGQVWLKADNKKSWKKYYFVLRTSGLYYAPKGKKSSKDLVCLSTFDVNQVYYGAGWKKKYKSPTDFCFAIKHPKIQAKTPKYTRYLCVDTEMEMHQWVTGIRVAKSGKQLFNNYRAIEEEITHADIDILTSKRFSGVNGINVVKNGTTSPTEARTPSSENKSLDSALSSGIVSDVTSGGHSVSDHGHNGHSHAHHAEITPVNTIERNSGQLRRSMSKASSTSSSSGCLSDKCSSSGSQPLHPNGFDQDFPNGGTIKKRPSVIAKLPLTGLTRNIVRDSEEDSSSVGSGDNIRVGSGGTLLRNAVRQSLRKSSMEREQRFQGSTDQVHISTHTVQIHHPEQNHQVYQRSNQDEMMRCLPEEDLLPPPPRAESIDQHLDQLPSPPEDPDELPPPPPELSMATPVQAPVSSLKKPPPPLPPIMASRKPSKRISFDDDVQVIGIPDHDQEDQSAPNQILSFTKHTYNAQPKKLPSPPVNFVTDLQRVMNKKWQVAEKCREDVGISPHKVLGFRDNDLIQVRHIVGTPQAYSRDESVGAWVLQSQIYQPQQQPQSQEPLYAVCAKNHLNSPKKVPVNPAALPVAPPVVLREPTPEMHHHNGYQYPPHHMVNQRHCPQPPRIVKRAPPPPRRSETTQLTTTS